MLEDTLVIVLAGGVGERLYPLTKERAKPAVYFGGPYRIIDFPLSNCINSGLRRIFIATQYKSLSLNRHIRQGWSVVSEELGEFIEILPPQKRVSDNWYLGTADAVYQNLYSLQRESPRHVIILSGDHVYKMDYAKMLQFHKERGAAATLATLEVSIADSNRFGILTVNEDDRVVAFHEKPSQPTPIPGTTDVVLASMGVYIFETGPLVEALEEDARTDSHHDFGKNIIPAMFPKLPVYSYRFYDENKKSAKYWRDIGTIDAYYEASMDLCQVNPEFNLYDPEWPLRTYMPQAPPAKFVFNDEGRRGMALDSIISTGLHRLGQQSGGERALPERAGPQLLLYRALDSDAGRARGAALPHPQRHHRSRRAHPTRRGHRLQPRRGSAAAHRQRWRRGGGDAGRGAAHRARERPRARCRGGG